MFAEPRGIEPRPSNFQSDEQTTIYSTAPFVREEGFKPSVLERNGVTVHAATSYRLLSPKTFNSKNKFSIISLDERTRTFDLVLPKHAFYQLNYI